MKTISFEELAAVTILTFCENSAELGCPRDQEVDMWYRYLSDEEKVKVGDKLLEIIKRDGEKYEKEDKKTKKTKKSKKGQESQ